MGIQLHPTTVTGNVGLLYRLTQEVHLVSNLGRGFRVPNVFDLSTLGDRPGNRFAIPNPDLKPEEAYSVDVGAKVHTTRFTGEAFVFHTIIPNRIESELTGALSPSGRTIVQSANLNRVDLTGFELGGRFHVTDSLDLYGHLTYTYGRERFPDAQRDPADRIPPLNGSIGVLYRPTPSLVIESFV